MEEEKQDTREKYIDFTKVKESEVKIKEDQQEVKPLIQPPTPPPIIKKQIVQEEPPTKKIKKGFQISKIFMVGCIILILFSIVSSAYLYYEFNLIKEQKIIYDADWNCIAEKCTEYWTQEEFIKEHCKLNESGETNCAIEYEGQLITLSLDQINIQPDSMCKTSECAVEIPIRKNL